MASETLRFPDTDKAKLAEIEHWIEAATLAQTEFEKYGIEYAHLCRREGELEAQRPTVKQEAIRRIMADGKIAATNAEKLAGLDPEYLQHLELQRETVCQKNLAYTKMESAKMLAYLGLAAIRSIAGLV